MNPTQPTEKSSSFLKRIHNKIKATLSFFEILNSTFEFLLKIKTIISKALHAACRSFVLISSIFEGIGHIASIRKLSRKQSHFDNTVHGIRFVSGCVTIGLCIAAIVNPIFLATLVTVGLGISVGVKSLQAARYIKRIRQLKHDVKTLQTNPQRTPDEASRLNNLLARTKHLAKKRRKKVINVAVAVCTAGLIIASPLSPFVLTAVIALNVVHFGYRYSVVKKVKSYFTASNPHQSSTSSPAPRPANSNNNTAAEQETPVPNNHTTETPISKSKPIPIPKTQIKDSRQATFLREEETQLAKYLHDQPHPSYHDAHRYTEGTIESKTQTNNDAIQTEEHNAHSNENQEPKIFQFDEELEQKQKRSIKKDQHEDTDDESEGEGEPTLKE